MSAYSASKHAAEAFSASLAVELAGWDIHVWRSRCSSTSGGGGGIYDVAGGYSSNNLPCGGEVEVGLIAITNLLSGGASQPWIPLYRTLSK